MELLIPGLILVALMVYASTKIKKRAAEAFEPETIETERYTLQKPAGFLHVIDSPRHDFEAYSKEYSDDDSSRRATIEVDLLRDTDLKSVRESIRNASAKFDLTEETENVWRIETEVAANENGIKVFYKLVDSRAGSIYRMRFAVVAKHEDEYLDRIEETLDSFTLKTR
jgi:hypothetical protein